MINVGHVTTSNAFAVRVDAARRTSLVNDYGETVHTSKPFHFMATVTQPSQKEIKRLPESTLTSDAIRVTSQTELDTNSDIVMFHGSDYTVQFVDDYSHFGYWRAVCTRRHP